jgi:glycosyltransferase involved in cell wall biosynthesis
MSHKLLLGCAVWTPGYQAAYNVTLDQLLDQGTQTDGGKLRKTMKIVSLVHQFYPTCQYGAETYAYHLAQQLRQDGHTVSVFHRENHIPRQFVSGQVLQEEDVQVDGLGVHRVYLNPDHVFKHGALSYFKSTFHNPPIEQAFARYLDREQPDLIHVHHLLYLSGGLMGLAHQRGIRIVATLHDFWYFCMNAQLLRPDHTVCVKNPLKWLCGRCMAAQYRIRWSNVTPVLFPLFILRDSYLRQAISRADVLMSPSHFLMEQHAQRKFPADKMMFLEYGINLDEIGPVERHDKPHLPLRFGYIGSLTRHKGVHMLVQAFNQLPAGQATLDVYGSPDAVPEYSVELKAMAGDNPTIRFRGAFDHAQIGQILSQLDMIIVPSVWYENSPVTIREAIAAQVPVIASRIGSLPEKVRDGVDGLLFEVGNTDDLTGKMLQVTQRPEQIETFRRNLTAPSDIQSHVERVIEIYLRVMGTREQTL